MSSRSEAKVSPLRLGRPSYVCLLCKQHQPMFSPLGGSIDGICPQCRRVALGKCTIYERGSGKGAIPRNLVTQYRLERSKS
ncbi:MAG TPA: hypothetical protein VKV28_14300 [Candidatus Binataceae bacterium]|nr:hypothetical protein [Candidatus Binataceae bacterium]